VKILGERTVSTLEGAFQIFKVIKDQGIGGLWEYIKEQLANLKELVLDGIKDMVITQVIQAGVQWLLGILGGPAGAFIKAAKAIYDIVMWFVNNGSRMMALLNAVIDAIGAIASGSVGQAAQFIERTLANAIPVVIGFLASLLGLGNLGQQIRGIIQKIQQPVQKAIDWVLGKARSFASKVLGKVKGAFGKQDSPAEKEKRLKIGLAAGVAAVNQLRGRKVTAALIRPILAGLRMRYRLSVLEPVVHDKYWHVRAEVQRALAKTNVSVDEDEPASVAEEIQAIFAELQGSPTAAAVESESIRVAAEEQKGKTRLSPTSASFSRAVLHAAIDQVESAGGPDPTLEAAKKKAHALVDAKIDQALKATDGDQIFRIITSVQTTVNDLLKGRVVAVTMKRAGFAKGLETHHAPEVHEYPYTYPKEFRKRVDIPEKWRVEIETWARELVKTVKSRKERARRRKAYVAKLSRVVRDSLTERKADQPHRSRAVLEEVEMFVLTQPSHKAHHQRTEGSE
jgi:hypothetical protein